MRSCLLQEQRRTCKREKLRVLCQKVERGEHELGNPKHAQHGLLGRRERAVLDCRIEVAERMNHVWLMLG